MVRVSTIFNASASIVRLLSSLFVIWLTLGWKVRTARKAFERELIAEGMTREDARRLSAQFEVLKDDIISAFKHSIVRF